MANARLLRRMSALALAAGLSATGGRAARADDTSAVDQIVQVLRDKGLIDQQTGDEIMSKQAQAESKAAQQAAGAPPANAQAPGVLSRFIWSGDLRLRDEQFWYGHNGLGQEPANDNNRFRYRVRFGFTNDVLPWATIGVRLATANANGQYNSTNISAGETSNFAYDQVFFDRAYAQFRLPDPGNIGLATTLTAGKFANPFTWNHGLDKILWDEDITPEGVVAAFNYSPGENVKLFMNTGYFVELQNASHSDPRAWAFQGGGSIKVAEALEFGARVSFYDWEALKNDPNEIPGDEGLGNLPTAFNPDAHIIESSGYMTWAATTNWPITFWGTWIQNLAASDGIVKGVHVGANDVAYGFGAEIGDPRAWFKAGLAWQHVEANAVVALYTDSDMFDGQTNREGIALYGSREVAANTEVRLWLWDKSPIKTTGSGVGGGPFNISPAVDKQADRLRLQADLLFKY